MNVPRLLLAAAVAFVFLALANAVFLPLFLPAGILELFRETRPESLVSLHFAAFLVTSLLIAYVFPTGYKGGKRWVEGLRCGMLLGALGSLPVNFHVFASVRAPGSDLVTVVLWTIITWGIAGALVATAYGKALKV